MIANKLRHVLAKATFKRVGNCRRAREDFPPFLGGTDKHAVYWVGHSLMQETVTTETEGALNLFRFMGMFCESRSLQYEMFDHTLYGAPLSLQWRGRPHSYQRTADEMQDHRSQFAVRAKAYDTFVLTEVVPVKNVFQLEYSAYYLQQYRDAIVAANPRARIYIYESWDYLHGGIAAIVPRPHSWLTAMREQRDYWERLADTASLGRAVPPRVSDQLKLLLRGAPKQTLPVGRAIYLIPVGQAFIALRHALAKGATSFVKANGEALHFYELFANPYTNWPEAGEKTPEDKLCLLHPERVPDDIHPSIIGIYLVALVHFATLYGQNPNGLVAPKEIGQNLAEKLQAIAWETVCKDPRSGVCAA